MPYTVLIVDDDRDFLEEFREILEEEYDVVHATSGEEALAIMKKPNLVDLVVLDVRMPGLQGTEVLKRMKEIAPGVFIVILTGYSTKDVLVESLRGHADDFLEKPLKIEQTLATIRRLLSKKQQEVEGIIEKIKYFIEKNYHKNISLIEASDAIHLSPKYISRIFKDNYGVGFNDYKLQLKMGKAKELLEKTDLTVNEISYKIGYVNAESFVRMFKKIVKATPSQYREQHAVKK
jgi:two-component system, response regulator YesN